MSQEIENQVERFFENVGKWWQQVVNTAKESVQTKETDVGPNKKQIQVELPEPPEGEEALAEYRKVCNARILEAVPSGYSLKSSEVKEERIVKHYADIVVEKS